MKTLSKYIFLNTLLFLSFSCIAQNIEIQIVDNEFKAIEYVNVYVIESNYGTISDLNGKVKLDNENIDLKDSIHFSCIGFIDKTLIIKDLLQLGNKKLILQEKSYSFEDIKITAKKIKYKKRKSGTKAILNLCQIGFNVNKINTGKEMGIIMKNNNACYLRSIHFNLESVSHDSMIFELNIYDYNNEIGSNMNKNRIFIQLDKNNPANSINLRDQNIRLSGDYFVSFEAVDVRDNNWAIFFKAKCKDQNLYLIKDNTGIWKNEGGLNPSIWCKMDCINE
jgi:hypothetical protein